MSYNISICLCNIIYRQHSSTWELTEARHDEDDQVTAERTELRGLSGEVLTWWLSACVPSAVLPRSLVSSCLLKKYPLSGEQSRAEVIPWVQHPGCNNSQNIKIERAFTTRVRSSQYYYDRSHQEPPSPAWSLLHHTRPWLNQPLILTHTNLLCSHSNSKSNIIAIFCKYSAM